jgi:hypothetical protein
MVSFPLFPWTTSSAVVTDSCHVHSSSPLAASDLVQGVGYSEFEVKTDMADLKLETDSAALELETDIGTLKLETNTTILDLEMATDVYQEISKQERYSAH